ncbi:hypothetical protein F2Q68_00014400 [Brassica cretica]|uniref:F-box domain-containing protein n=2 Tax=Brassica cretica TaxID=69181 RepID=A0A8S9HJA3_BRACR|nr:hypothetical protein F2Q68_00014400 [Brassica cretica]KAF3605462.1 hypothetical protein DY000_02046889 [Brassica cretica]
MNIEKNNNPVKSRKIIKRCTHSSTISSMYAGENLDTFPMDLINEILKRLPAKTIAICQCVSKQWAFLLGSPHFTKSFLTCSTTRPRLLFTFELGGKWHFFSSPQPRNADEQLITIWMSNGNTKLERVPVLCNPSTGQHVHLPKVKAKNKDFRSFLGYDPIENQFKIGSANSQLHQRFTVDTERTMERERYHWKDLDARFSDHLSDRQIDFAFTTTLEMNLLWLSKWCPIGVNLVSMDRGHIVLHYDRRDLKFNESSGVALLEPSRSIRRFLRFLQNPWQRDVWTSDAALVGGGSETSGLATQIVWGVGAETFAFDAALEGGGIETYCTSDAAYESCLFMLELNFYSGSSITQMRLARRSDCYRAGVTLCLPDIFFFARKSIWGSDMGEIFWAPKRWTYPFYVFYYNVERQSVRRVEIKGIEEKVLMGRDRLERVFTFTNHVENLMFLQ